MPSLIEYDHSPSSSLDYGVDWSSWLLSGEEILTSDWDISPSLTLSSPASSTTLTSVFVTGGEVGVIYRLTNTITTSLSKTDNRVLILSCKHRYLSR